MPRELVDGRVVVSVGKAAPMRAGEHTPDVCIEVSQAIPQFPPWPDTLPAAERYYGDDAKRIEAALHNALPGGTYDRLLGLMLARKASHFRVPHGSGEEG